MCREAPRLLLLLVLVVRMGLVGNDGTRSLLAGSVSRRAGMVTAMSTHGNGPEAFSGRRQYKRTYAGTSMTRVCYEIGVLGIAR